MALYARLKIINWLLLWGLNDVFRSKLGVAFIEEAVYQWSWFWLCTVHFGFSIVWQKLKNKLEGIQNICGGKCELICTFHWSLNLVEWVNIMKREKEEKINLLTKRELHKSGIWFRLGITTQSQSENFHIGSSIADWQIFRLSNDFRIGIVYGLENSPWRFQASQGRHPKEIHSCPHQYQWFSPWVYRCTSSTLPLSLWTGVVLSILNCIFYKWITMLSRNIPTDWVRKSEAPWNSADNERNSNSVWSDQNVWRGEDIYVPEMQAHVGLIHETLLFRMCVQMCTHTYLYT